MKKFTMYYWENAKTPLVDIEAETEEEAAEKLQEMVAREEIAADEIVDTGLVTKFGRGGCSSKTKKVPGRGLYDRQQIARRIRTVLDALSTIATNLEHNSPMEAGYLGEKSAALSHIYKDLREFEHSDRA